MRRLLWLCFAALLLPGCVIVSADLNPFNERPQSLSEQVVWGEGKDKILLIDISRVIGNTDEEGPLGLSSRPSLTTRVREELEHAADDARVKAIVLRINSPGGTVTASDVIYHELMTFKQNRKVPIVAHTLDFATSGAYYIALAADEIVASPTSVTGSVGVIMVGLNLTGLMDKIGVSNQTLKAGALKDSGSPLRPMTSRDQAVLQAVLDNMDRRFLDLVRERRPGMNAEELTTLSDARVVNANEALSLKMVDRIGYFEDAIAAAQVRAGVSQARVIMYRRPNEYSENIYSRAALPQPQVNLVNLDFGSLSQSPQFLYMWAPGAEGFLNNDRR